MSDIHSCETESFQLDCGCRFEKCSVCGVTRLVERCKVDQPKDYEPAIYYLNELCGQVHGIPRHSIIAGEFKSALLDMGVEIPIGSPATHKALDVGAGIGLYAHWMLRCGYFYEAVDSSPWAIKWIEGAYGGPVHRCRFEDFPDTLQYDLIISGHCLEHFQDAKASLAKMARLLRPDGLLLLVIPDNSDLLNPDHHWFFTVAGIERWLADLGFSDVRTNEKQIVPREKFIYVAAKRKAIA